MGFERKITEALNKKTWIIPMLFGLMCFYFAGSFAVIEVLGFENLQPTFAFSIGGELFAIMVAIVIVASILPTYKRQSDYIRIFVTLLAAGCSVCFLDIVQMTIDGIAELAMLNRVICIFVFSTEVFFTYFFWLYISYVLKVKNAAMGVMSTIAASFLIVFALLPFLNFAAPIYFTINESGIYERVRETWWICRIYIVIIVIFVIITLFMSKEKFKTKLVVIIFMGLPLIAVGAAGYQYGVSVLYSTMMVSLVLIYSILFSDNEKHLYSTNKELGLATNIQQHMLPSIFPAFPERKEFDIYALMEPAKEVGGDFYDFFLIDDTHLGLVIADVSDKGIPAALFMMASKIMVQNYAMMGYSPKEVLTRVNNQICMNHQDEMFVTIWFGVLDLETGILTASNGGHEKPILKNPNGHFEVINDKHNLVVGFFPGTPYSEYQIKLEKGSKLYLYTDGVPEARDKNEQFGINRALEVLVKNEDLSVNEICNNVLTELTTFIGKNTQFDDITMLCLEYRGYNDNRKRISLHTEVDDITEKGIKPIIDFVKELGADHKTIYKIELALEELLVNVASYAYAPGNGKIEVEYWLEENPRKIVVKIQDEGKPFNPLKSQDPDTTLPTEERKIGGLGIFLVKKTMDELKYERKNNKNVLIIKNVI